MKVPLQTQQKPFDHFEILVLVIPELSFALPHQLVSLQGPWTA